MYKILRFLVKLYFGKSKTYQKIYPIYIWPSGTPIKINVSQIEGEIIAVDIQFNKIIQYKIQYFSKVLNETIVIWLYEDEFSILRSKINKKQGLGFKVFNNNE